MSEVFMSDRDDELKKKEKNGDFVKGNEEGKQKGRF